MLGAPHEQPTFTPAFEKDVIFQVQIAFQLRFSCVSAAFQLRFSCVSATFQLTRSYLFRLLFFGRKISAFLKVKLLVKLFFRVSAAFQLAKTGCSPSVWMGAFFSRRVAKSGISLWERIIPCRACLPCLKVLMISSSWHSKATSSGRLLLRKHLSTCGHRPS